MQPEEFEVERLLEHEGFLRGLLRALVTDESQIDDVVQQTWLTAIENPPKSSESLQGWIGRVAKNWARKSRRGEIRRSVRERTRADHGGKEPEPDPVRALEHRRLLREVTQAVLSLEEPYRSMILMRYYQGLGTREIATSLGISYSAARTRLKRAARRLRARLDHLEPPEGPGWRGLALAILSDDGDASDSGGGVSSPDPSSPDSSSPVESRTFAQASRSEARTIRMEWSPGLSAGLAAAGLGLVLGIGWWWSSETAPGRRRAEEDRHPRAEESRAASVPGEGDAWERSSSDRTLLGSSGGEAAHGVRESVALNVRLVWEEDGTPAQGVSFLIRPPRWRSNRDLASAVWGRDFLYRTDAEGQVVVPDVEFGDWEIVAGRSKPLPGFRIDRDSQPEILVEIPRGGMIRGKVVDRDGWVVPGAGIYFSRDYVDGGYRIAEADEQGEFTIRDVSVLGLFGARAPGLTPVGWQLVRAVAGDEVGLELEVESGGELGGVVLDAEGGPVPGAEVSILGKRPMRFFRSGEELERVGELSSMMLWARTDSGGSFYFPGLFPEEKVLLVRRDPFAVTRTSVPLEAGRSNFVEVVLEAPSRLEGRVVSSRGRGLGGVEVAVRPEGAPFPRFEILATTEDDGSYLVESAPAQRYRAQILGRTKMISAVSGERVEWMVTLGDREVLEGVLTGAEGEPLPGWRVEVQTTIPLKVPNQTWVSREGITDERGEFCVAGCPERGFLVSVYPPSRESFRVGTPVLQSEGHRTTDGPVRLQVPGPRMPSAWVRGKLVGQGGQPVSGRVSLVNPSQPGGALVCLTEADGDFQGGPIPPGRYGVAAYFGTVNQESPWGVVEFEPGKTVDLGRLTESVPGGVVVRSRNPHPPGCRPLVALRAPSVDWTSWLNARGRTHSAKIPAGEYDLFVEGPGVARQAFSVSVGSGEVVEVEFDCAPGIPQKLLLETPVGRFPCRMFRVRMENQRGELMLRQAFLVDELGRLEILVWLFPDTYHLFVRTETGLRGHVEFEVEEGAMPPLVSIDWEQS